MCEKAFVCFAYVCNAVRLYSVQKSAGIGNGCKIGIGIGIDDLDDGIDSTVDDGIDNAIDDDLDNAIEDALDNAIDDDLNDAIGTVARE